MLDKVGPGLFLGIIHCDRAELLDLVHAEAGRRELGNGGKGAAHHPSAQHAEEPAFPRTVAAVCSRHLRRARQPGKQFIHFGGVALRFDQRQHDAEGARGLGLFQSSFGGYLVNQFLHVPV